MSEHKALLKWELTEGDFLKGRFSRKHTWTFDGGLTVAASPSPAVVRAPYSDAEAVDPEEAYVASIASCHMLTFLYLASRKKFEIRRYEDEARGQVAKDENGVPWVATVTLHPKIGMRRRPSDPRAGRTTPSRRSQTVLYRQLGQDGDRYRKRRDLTKPFSQTNIQTYGAGFVA